MLNELGNITDALIAFAFAFAVTVSLFSINSTFVDVGSHGRNDRGKLPGDANDR